MGFDAIAAVGEDVLASGAADAAAGAAVDAGVGAAADAGLGAAADVGAGALGAGAVDAAAGAGAAGLSSADAAAIYGGAGYGAAADATTLGATAADTAALGAAGADAGAVGSSITGGAGGAFSDAGFAASDAGAATGLDSGYVGAGTADYGAGAAGGGTGAADFNDATGTYTSPTGDTTTLPNQAANTLDSGTGNSSLDNALKQLGAAGNGAMKYAPLASLGMNAYAQHKAQSAADQLKGVAQPASDVSNQLLGQYKSGTLNPSDAFAIAQWSQQQTASIKNYYAQAGLSNSSMEASALSQVGAQADAMRSQALTAMMNSGLQAAGLAQGPQVAAVNASVAADQQLSQASSNFMAALAKMNGQQNGTAANATPGG